MRSHSIRTGAAILLVAGNKRGVNQKRFYRQLILKADKLYSVHLAWIEEQKKGKATEDG